MGNCLEPKNKSVKEPGSKSDQANTQSVEWLEFTKSKYLE